MIKIVIPANMDQTVLTHLEAAGRKANFADGEDFGLVNRRTQEEDIDQIIRLRSFDVPSEVSDSCDVGLCGSDWVREKELELGLGLTVLENYYYGRKFNAPVPRLEIVVNDEDPARSTRELQPGVILCEYPLLVKSFLETSGWTGRVVQIGHNNGVPSKPKEFRNYCEEKGFLGIRVVHGKVPALVRAGAGYGVMVNETGETVQRNNLRVIDEIEKIRTQLIADPEALQEGTELAAEIRRFQQDLNEGFRKISAEGQLRRPEGNFASDVPEHMRGPSVER